MKRLLTNKEIAAKYGNPGDMKNLITLVLPFPMLLDWDVTKVIKTMAVHKLVAPKLEGVFSDLLAHYGPQQLHDLGINQTGGCFNHRPKRGLEERFTLALSLGDIDAANECLSTHSWGVAVDLDPNRNLWRETSRTARFARKEYRPMIEIFYAHGFLGYGPEKNMDWMHWEVAE